MFWWIVLAVVVVGFALAWWSSGRARRGVDSVAESRARGKTEGTLYPYKNNGPFGGPGNNGF
ncbi:hypothetical protein [Nocardioides ungokensis]